MNTSANCKPVIGLAGGVGAGKSTAAEAFAELGCTCVDADRLGHDVLNDPDVCRAISRRWGDEVFDEDGTVNRSRLARAVFARPGETSALNELLHPRIRILAERQIDRAMRDPSVKAVVLDAALLLEADWGDMCTHLVFVAVPDDLRRSRSCRRDGWDEREWSMREKSQFLLDKKASRCDYTIDNSSTVSRLHEQVREIFERIVHAADHPL